MNKSFIFVVVLCYLVACAQDQKEPEYDVSSLIKNVMVEENKENAPKGNIGLSQSELDNMLSGIYPCWNVNVGGKYAEELAVMLRVYINPDMSVYKADILDQMRYNSDTHYKAAAEAARRSLLNPRCNKLNLSPDKFEQWKSFTILFDPKVML